MEILKKLWGFRSSKLWQKIFACIYYICCLILFINALTEIPNIYANIYDLFIYKFSSSLKALSFFLPIFLLSDFKFKEKIPLLNKNKWWSNVISVFIIFLIIISFSQIINLFHSDDYKERYEIYSQTEIIYTEHDPDEIPKEDQSSLTENELEDDLNDLIDDDNSKDNNSIDNNVTDIPNDDIVDIPSNNENDNLLKVHFIDVEQGDSIFIELPNRQTMLIDAGESYKGEIISNYIRKLEYSDIDYIIGTHPHADHIGGLAYIINNFDVGRIYMPKAVSTSKTYENLLNTISQKGLKVTTAKSGINILNSEKLKIDIIAPNSDSYNNLNNYSAVIKIVYGNRKFLFMGDAETKSENEIISDVSADVIKIGHHGSDISSGQSFVNKVNAKYAIIMVGNNNKYDHPYQTIIDRWVNSGAEVYRTDKDGNIIVSSDGNSLNINTSQ